MAEIKFNPENDGIIISDYVDSTYYWLEFDQDEAILGMFADGSDAPVTIRHDSLYEALAQFAKMIQPEATICQ